MLSRWLTPRNVIIGVPDKEEVPLVPIERKQSTHPSFACTVDRHGTEEVLGSAWLTVELRPSCLWRPSTRFNHVTKDRSHSCSDKIK